MFITFACSACGQNLKARTQLAGQKQRCPQCGQTVVITETDPQAPHPVPAGREPEKRRRSMLRWVAGALVLVLVLAGLGWRVWRRWQPAKNPSFINKSVGQESFPEVDEEGFHFQEYSADNGDRPFRWTNGHGRLGIPIDPTNPPEALVVQLAAYRGPGTRKARLEIVVNNHSVFKDDIPPGPWDQRVDLHGISLGEQVVVELISDTFWPLGNPRGDGPGVSDDTRMLGVLVWGITLVGKE
jgi:DNA-directed RNA polymerase subunit RPC12/RpoP